MSVRTGILAAGAGLEVFTRVYNSPDGSDFKDEERCARGEHLQLKKEPRACEDDPFVPLHGTRKVMRSADVHSFGAAYSGVPA